MKKFKKSKKYFSFGLILVLLISILNLSNPAEVKAYEYAVQDAASQNNTRASDNYFTDYDDVCTYIRGQLAARSETITVSVASEVVDSLSSVYDFYYGAIEYYSGCKSNEGDALSNEISLGSTKVYNYGTYKTLVTTISYYTDAEKEAELDAAIKQTLYDMKLDGKSDYQKARAIFDYVCDHVNYDYEHLEDNTYLLKQTAYAAMFNKTSVCQGYAVLFYRMCIEAGVECRVVPGWGNGGSHAWNIVKIGDYWYNVDSTWDGQNDDTTHNWFLMNDEDFLNHTRKSEFASEEFYVKYPMASESWKDYSNTTEIPNYSNLPVYHYNTINDTVITNQADGRPKVIIFFRNTCGNSQYTIQSICNNTPEGVDIIAVNVDTDTKESVTEFKNSYGSDNVKFVYSIKEFTYNSSHAFAYYQMFSTDSSFVIPLIIYIDANNKVQHYTTSAVSASALKRNIEDYCSGGMNWELEIEETMSVGDTCRGKVLLNGGRKNEQFFKWESSDTSVASVDSCGNISALSSGSAIISYRFGDKVLAQKQITVVTQGYTGLQMIDGKWYYFSNGKVDTGKNGLVKGADGVFWYVNGGMIQTSYTGFVRNGAGNWYVIGGKIDITFTGLGKDGDEWRCVINGKEYPTYTGLIQNAGYFWYIKDGVVDTTYTGFYENEHGKWYVRTGKIDTSFTGLGKEGNKWLCVRNGKYDSTYTGLVKNGGEFWYVENGELKSGFSGIVETGESKWLVGTGKLDSKYSGSYKDATGTIYNIKNGKVIE